MNFLLFLLPFWLDLGGGGLPLSQPPPFVWQSVGTCFYKQENVEYHVSYGCYRLFWPKELNKSYLLLTGNGIGGLAGAMPLILISYDIPTNTTITKHHRFEIAWRNVRHFDVSSKEFHNGIEFQPKIFFGEET